MKMEINGRNSAMDFASIEFHMPIKNKISINEIEKNSKQ